MESEFVMHIKASPTDGAIQRIIDEVKNAPVSLSSKFSTQIGGYLSDWMNVFVLNRSIPVPDSVHYYQLGQIELVRGLVSYLLLKLDPSIYKDTVYIDTAQRNNFGVVLTTHEGVSHRVIHVSYDQGNFKVTNDYFKELF